MYENFDGSSPNQTKGAQNVARRFRVEPEDRVSFGDHNECLKNTKLSMKFVIFCTKNNISINSLRDPAWSCNDTF